MMRETPEPERLHKPLLDPIQFDLDILAIMPATSSFSKHENIVEGLLRDYYRGK